MKLPCENCPFSETDQPCEPAIEDWRRWRETPEGLLVASYAGECQQNRKNSGDTPDPLTGIDNYLLLKTKLQKRFGHATRRGEQVIDELGVSVSPILAAFIDGDHFGDYNKKRSQLVGDEFIKALGATIGEVIVDNTRESDLVGRRGGDEFVVAMFGLTRQHAREKMMRMRAKLREGGAIDGMTWMATTTAVYLEDPRGVDDVEAAFDYASGILGDWKLSDRQEEPPLLIEIQPDQEPCILA